MITVIVPVYNAEKYVCKCIESVISQTYTDWELLLIDDASSDNSGKICQSYANRHNNIIYHLINHQGVSYARNVGIDQSTGEYIFFMDADDYLHPEALSILISKIKNSDVDMVSAECQSVMYDGTIYPHSRPTFKDELIDNHKFLCDVLTYNTLCAIWGKLYKRSLIGNCRFVVGLNRAQDIMFLTTVFSQNKCKVLRCADKVYYYRILQNSVSHSKNPLQQIKSIKAYISSMIDFRDRHPNVDIEYRKEFSYHILRNTLQCIELQSFYKHVDSWHIDMIGKYLPICFDYNDCYTSLAAKIIRQPEVLRNIGATLHYLPAIAKKDLRTIRNSLYKTFHL